MTSQAEVVIEVQGLDIGYEDHVVMNNLSFSINKGDIFIVMGMNGCGKSTLLKSLIGLRAPMKGKILYEGKSFWDEDETGMQMMTRGFGILYQRGALWSSLTVEENVALPLQLYTKLSASEIKKKVALKLSKVGLEGKEDDLPSGLSGGMQRRASLARAIALDPKIIFFDEPSAGLDPINSRKLDDLILDIRDSSGATIVVITHELPSIFAIGNNSIFLDVESQTMIASGDPKNLLANSKDPRVIQFLTRAKV
ncbi:MAG: ATP-binding cassette domain-containing protein [Candidatus Omnitrophica bacterium]|nr:ATP-binding cassette domain-containing protein [Candidatus Omnitrophota bacterium]